MSEQKTIGRYIVGKLLGQGNMGSVYLGFDPNLKRPVAIKTINANLKKNPKDSQSFEDRFFQEARANSRLVHPNIVGVFDSGVHEGDPYLIMEYVKGSSLEEVLEVGLADDLQIKCALMVQIAAGLDHAHKIGVVHRDIKPANILVTKEFEAKILDFGLARLKDSTLTTTGTFLGTPSYTSPEQIISGKVDDRSDIFSAAIVAYEMFTGSRPFPGENINSILYHIANSPPNLEFENLELGPSLDAVRAVFAKALDKDPENRYQTAGHLAFDLNNALLHGKAPNPDEAPTAGLPGSSIAALGSLNLAAASAMIERRETKKADRSDDINQPTVVLERSAVAGNVSGAQSALSLRLAQKLVAEKKSLLIGVGAALALILFLLIPRPKAKDETTEPTAAPRAETSQPSTTADAADETRPPPDAAAANGDVSSQEPAPGDDAEGGSFNDDFNDRFQEGVVVRIEELEKEFMAQVADSNIKAAEATLKELKILGAESDNFESVLKTVRNQRISRAESRRLERRKRQLQSDFKTADESADIPTMEKALAEYSKTFPHDEIVQKALRDTLNRHKKKRNDKIRDARSKLNTALNTRDTDKAKAQLERLITLGVADDEIRAKVNHVVETTYTNSLGMKFIRLPAGTFMMGPGPKHEVELTKPFYMGMYEVTQGEWRAVMGENPSKFEDDAKPVESITYKDCLQFISKLNQLESGSIYRLPSEAEWEYACRAGTTTDYATGNQLSPNQANFKDTNLPSPQPPGRYPPNPWGLFDMHGNVAEWCQDVLEDYPATRQVDPVNNGGGNSRVYRGGSYASESDKTTSAYRTKRSRRSPQVGLRLVLETR